MEEIKRTASNGNPRSIVFGMAESLSNANFVRGGTNGYARDIGQKVGGIEKIATTDKVSRAVEPERFPVFSISPDNPFNSRPSPHRAGSPNSN